MNRNNGRDKGAKLQPNVAVAADLMASGVSDAEIADQMGVHRSTVGRWRQRPQVAEEVAKLQRNAAQGARARLATCVHGALTVLMELAEDKGADAEIRYKAALAVIDKGLPAMDVSAPPSTTLQFNNNFSIEDAKTLVRETRKGVVDV